MTTAAEQLATFKSFYPNIEHVQALTLDDATRIVGGKPVDWNSVTPADFAPSSTTAITACQKAVGFVIFDVICLAVGAVGLRTTVRASTIEAMASAAESSLPKIETIIAQMGASNATVTDRAWGVFQILKTIYTGGSLGAVFNAFTGSLTWWNMILYGVTGIATITAAFATDGLALAAEIVILLATAGFLASDTIAAINACGMTPTTPPSGPTPQPGEPYLPSIAIRTYSGNYITAVNNGGMQGSSGDVIATNRTQVGSWEKFTLVPLDASNNTFALQTMTGNYVTAVNGGGIPNGAEQPIATNRTQVGGWESLVLIQQTDGTYAIATTSRFFLTAVNGGGIPNGAGQPIATNRTALGEWETFTFDSL